MTEIRGALDARGARFAIAAASFNEMVVGKLVEGALACFHANGIGDDDLVVAWVPGAFELPLIARRLAEGGWFDAVVCLGAVIRGETAHFDYVAGEAARGIQQVMQDTGVPLAFGVLTTENLDQALDRAGGKHGNKGWDAAMAAMQMAGVLAGLPAAVVQGGSRPAKRIGAGQPAAAPVAKKADRRAAFLREAKR